MKYRPRTASLSVDALSVTLTVFTAILFAVAFFSLVAHATFVSSEVKFTDASASGLAIMPASCASTPSHEVCRQAITAYCRTIDNNEECTTTRQQTGTDGNPQGGWQPRFETVCTTFSAGPNPHFVGECDLPDQCPNMIGYQSSTSECPDGPTDACPNMAGIQSSPSDCPSTSRYSCNAGNQCVQDSSGPYTSSSCNNECVPDSCPLPRQIIGGVCRCPAGYTYQSSTNQCIFDNCPAGQARNPIDNQCHVLCPNGTTFAPNDDINQCSQCAANMGQTCFAHNSCGMPGAAGVVQCSGACSAFPPSENLCVAAPRIITWLVRPLLVQSGSPTFLTWNTANVASCSVSGTNGDGKQGASCPQGWCATSGTHLQSGPILGQTTYMLTCIGNNNSTIATSSTVNIVPVFQEN